MATNKGMKLEPAQPDRPIDWLLTPFQAFARMEAAGGILLIICTAVALVWANSPWKQSYYDVWHTYLSIGFGSYTIKASLAHWVNDGLMAIFFFVVGLEIKREILVGELASFRKAAVPIMAAIGGMIFPAMVYAILNYGKEGISGWPIPAATDIAFALGIMALLGKRVPVSLKIFLTALAIVDDIGAVLIIALLFTSDLSYMALAAGGGILVLLIGANRLHVRNPLVYIVLGLGLWLAFFESGIHATIAGVVLAFTIPSSFRIKGATFSAFTRKAIDEFDKRGGNENDIETNPARQSVVHAMEQACEQVQTPLLRLEHELHPWVSFLIMPVFAMANAGVALGGGVTEALTSSVGLGVILGLVVGKQVGVTLATWIAVKAGIGQLPDRTSWMQIYGTSWLAGFGFTMSLFIGNLAFSDNEALLEYSKLGILAGSTLAGVGGYLILRMSASKEATE